MKKCVTVIHCLLALCDAVFCAILFEKESSIEAESFDHRKFFHSKTLTAGARARHRSADWQSIYIDFYVIEDFTIEKAVKNTEIDENRWKLFVSIEASFEETIPMTTTKGSHPRGETP